MTDLSAIEKLAPVHVKHIHINFAARFGGQLPGNLTSSTTECTIYYFLHTKCVKDKKKHFTVSKDAFISRLTDRCILSIIFVLNFKFTLFHLKPTKLTCECWFGAIFGALNFLCVSYNRMLHSTHSNNLRRPYCDKWN